MAENNTQNTSNKIDQMLKYILEFGGAIFIICIVLVLGFMVSLRSCENKNDKSYIKLLNESKISYYELPNKKLDSSHIVLSEELIQIMNQKNDSINSKIEQINKVSSNLREIQKENIESFRFYLTLIGFIFALVGFFGFKSIFDTRQAAIERAVFDAKVSAESKAKEIAELESKKIAGEKAKEVAKEDVKIHTKTEVELYLNDNLKKHIEKLESDIIKDFDERIKIVELNINKLSRPESFNEIERPQIFNLINEQLTTLNDEIIALKKEMFNFKNEELKKSIISELNKK